MAIRPEWLFDGSEIPDPEGRADKVLRFADLLRHPKAEDGDGRPLTMEWQRRLLSSVYGPVDARGNRLVRTVYLQLPRGARKTSIAAVITLAHLIGPAQRVGGQIVSAASDRSQARICFDECRSLITGDPRLEAAVRVRDTKSKLEHRKSSSVYSAISADGDAQHGRTPTLIIADELHAWRGFDLWGALKTGASKTPGSLTIIATTAGGRSEGVCWELRKHAQRCIEDPGFDPTFLPVVFEAEAGDRWDDEDLWAYLNPGLSAGFPALDELRSEAKMAANSPQLREAFETLHLNRWLDGGSAGWIEMAVWDEGAVPVDEEALEGAPCWIGVDLSRTYDLTAIAAAFPDDDGGFDVLVRAFIPKEGYQKRMTETPDVPWRAWRESGALTVIPGSVIDDDVIEEALADWCDRFDVREIGCDPKFAGKLIQGLLERDLPAVEVPQRPTILTPCYGALQKAVIGRKLRHGGHAVLRWCAANGVPVTSDGGLWFLSKRKSTGAIDAIVAAAMAVGRADAEAGGPSVYESIELRPEGLLFA